MRTALLVSLALAASVVAFAPQASAFACNSVDNVVNTLTVHCHGGLTAGGSADVQAGAEGQHACAEIDDDYDCGH